MINLRTRAILFMRVNRRFVSHRLLAEKSIERQRELGKQVARRLAATIVREYVDQSGAVLFGNRPQLQAMLASLKSRPVHYVIVEDWATLTGNPSQAAAVLTAITDSGAELVVGDGAAGQPDDFDDEPHEPADEQT